MFSNAIVVVKSIPIKIFRKIVWRLPKKLAHKIIFFSHHRKWMNMKKPITYDEKIHQLSAEVYDESYGRYVDKYAVREYVKSCGLGELLIPLYGVWEDVEEIDYNSLPNQFILKLTHGSGPRFYAICENKEAFHQLEVERLLRKGFKEKFGRRHCEYQYENIPPRIVCEQLLIDKTKKRLNDYKVVCVNGVPQKILVCTERNRGLDYYTIDWEYLEHVKLEFRSGRIEEKPKCLQEMLNAAAILSKPFPLARIDFYIVNEKLYFGEITLTPSAGYHADQNEEGQMHWCDLVCTY